MDIQSFPTGPYATNMYIISCKSTKEAVIVDPGVGAYEIALKYMQQHSIKPVAIWLTHSHWDHIADVVKIKNNLSLPVYIHKEDRENLKNPGSDGVPMAVRAFEGTTPDHFISEGDDVRVGKLIFKVIHTPGHSPGGVCFFCVAEKKLISGDTLFKGLIGTLRLSTAEPERMWQSLRILSDLPPATDVFPGHGPATTIHDESWIVNAKGSDPLLGGGAKPHKS